MKKAVPAPSLPVPISVPVGQAAPGAETADQQAFRAAIREVESLREQLRARRAEQADARRRYWQQVGPVAAAVVAARRALFAPLEDALLQRYFSRSEEAQITELILSNAHSLQDRFGEDEGALIRKYAPPKTQAAAPPADAPSLAAAAASDRPPHEQAAAAARARRLPKAERLRQAAAEAEAQQLATNVKTLYRQLARTHHPDLERDPDKQAHQTAQMQRVTEAYEADDLYTLLQMLADSGTAEVSVLERHTLALHRQQARLEEELNALRPGPAGAAQSSAKKREAALRELKRALRAEAAYVQHIGQLMLAPASLRELLRELSAAGQAAI